MKKPLDYCILCCSFLMLLSCAKDIVDLTGNIQGTVKDYTTGQLLQNCIVELSPGGKSTSTSANGSFIYENLEAGTYTLSFSKSGYVDQTQEVKVVTGEVSKVEVALKLPEAVTGTISGTVKDYTTGQLLQNCIVELSPGGVSKLTDANGTFTFEKLDAGTYSLSFSKSGYVDQTQEVKVVTGEVSKVEVALKLPEAVTGTISGTVKDYTTGQFISNCSITLSPGGESKTSSSSGTYEFSDLTEGTYSLNFSKVGYDDFQTSVKVVAGKTTTSDVSMKAKSSFSISENSYDFGDLESSKIFYFTNNSDEITSFIISNIPSWISFSQTSGKVAASGSEAITALVNREMVSEGDYSQIITISYSGKSSGSVTLTVRMKKVVLSAPSVSIHDFAGNIGQSSFQIGGTITATGGSPISSYGHCWNTSGTPSINDSKTDLGSTDAAGSYKSIVENLSPSTTYYVRAYAKNDQGISYSAQISVTTQDVTSDKWDGNIASSFAGGSGTFVDPYQIKTGGQLLLMKNYNDQYFVLENNINLNNNNWLPFVFEGTLDGNGYSISNLKISRTTDDQGLFSTLYGTVQNLTISGVDIQAPNNDNIGVIAGSAMGNGTINNCHIILNSSSKLLGNNNIGGCIGIVGRDQYVSFGVSISNCTVTGPDINIKGVKYLGGLIGAISGSYNAECSLNTCSVNANLLGESVIGGLVGYFIEGKKCKIESSEYNGTISGQSVLGGILALGDGDYLSMTGSKTEAKLSVSGNGIAGGLVGRLDTSCYPMIYGCYATGTISGNSQATNLKGLIGSDESKSGYVELCYSTLVSNLTNFKYETYTDCASVESCSDITTYLKECYSEYAKYYNFNKTWIWTGTVNGVEKSVSCPKLAWE